MFIIRNRYILTHKTIHESESRFQFIYIISVVQFISFDLLRATIIWYAWLIHEKERGNQIILFKQQILVQSKIKTQMHKHVVRFAAHIFNDTVLSFPSQFHIQSIYIKMYSTITIRKRYTSLLFIVCLYLRIQILNAIINPLVHRINFAIYHVELIIHIPQFHLTLEFGFHLLHCLQILIKRKVLNQYVRIDTLL